MEQYVEFGRKRIHLSQEPQRTRYASNCATYGSARRYLIRSSSVRLARRRFVGGFASASAVLSGVYITGSVVCDDDMVLEETIEYG
jgi:hypothetical protein